MSELVINSVYAVELCSGEMRYWQYLGPDSRRLVWWLDTETKQEFNEASLMYAWSVKGCIKGQYAKSGSAEVLLETGPE